MLGRASRRRRASTLVLVPLLVPLIVLAVACGDDDGGTDGTATTSAGVTGSPSATTAATEPDARPEAPPPSGDAVTPATDGEAGRPPSTPPPVPAPDVLGTPGEFGVAYPAGSTCADVDALVGGGVLQADARAAVIGDDGIWLAVDLGSGSADVLFGPPAAESRLVTIRGGALASSGAPSVAQSPALTPEESYAITDIGADGTVTACIVGPVVV